MTDSYAQEPEGQVVAEPHVMYELLDRPIAFHPIFARVTGSVAGGILLSQMFYWSKRATMPGRWFYKTQEAWEAETAVNIKTQKRIRTRLIRLGILEEERRGVPAKLYYRLNVQALLDAISEYLAKTSTSSYQARLVDLSTLDTSICPDSSRQIDQSIPETYSETTSETTHTKRAREDGDLESSKKAKTMVMCADCLSEWKIDYPENHRAGCPRIFERPEQEGLAMETPPGMEFCHGCKIFRSYPDEIARGPGVFCIHCHGKQGDRLATGAELKERRCPYCDELVFFGTHDCGGEVVTEEELDHGCAMYHPGFPCEHMLGAITSVAVAWWPHHNVPPNPKIFLAEFRSKEELHRIAHAHSYADIDKAARWWADNRKREADRTMPLFFSQFATSLANAQATQAPGAELAWERYARKLEEQKHEQ